MQKTVNILRSQRKTLSIEIHPDGQVLVRAPLRTRQSTIDALLKEKQDWIEDKLAEMSQRSGQKPQHAYRADETFLYLGKAYPLNLSERARPALEFKNGFVLAKSAQPRAQDLLSAWYKREALQVFSQRLAFWAEQMNLQPARLRISSARTRWGSCSSQGTINLTWRLVMAPLEVIDYVVVHELAHLKVKNHSATFWKLVGNYMPDYAQKRKWLRLNGMQLDL